MLEKPALSDEKIIISLLDGFGVTATEVEFLPLGNDSTAWTYRVYTEKGENYFLKVKKGLVNPHSLSIPRHLKDHGLEQVVAPLPVRNGVAPQGLMPPDQPRNTRTTSQQADDRATPFLNLWYPAGEYTLLLYSFIEGANGMNTGLTDHQWIEYGSFLKQLHAIQLPPKLRKQIPQETFIPKWAKVIRQIQARLKQGHFTDLARQELSDFWLEKAEFIEQIVQKSEELGQLLQQQSLKFVLCHADIHTANLLVTPDQKIGSLGIGGEATTANPKEPKIFVVDWDETILAPRERDLMFIVGIPPEQEALFFQGYGKIDMNWAALAYYRYEWVVQEIGDYGERVFWMEGAGERTKRDAVQAFISLFQPGDVVEAAYKSEGKIR